MPPVARRFAPNPSLPSLDRMDLPLIAHVMRLELQKALIGYYNQPMGYGVSLFDLFPSQNMRMEDLSGQAAEEYLLSVPPLVHVPRWFSEGSPHIYVPPFCVESVGFIGKSFGRIDADGKQSSCGMVMVVLPDSFGPMREQGVPERMLPDSELLVLGHVWSRPDMIEEYFRLVLLHELTHALDRSAHRGMKRSYRNRPTEVKAFAQEMLDHMDAIETIPGKQGQAITKVIDGQLHHPWAAKKWNNMDDVAKRLFFRLVTSEAAKRGWLDQ